jgi:hypothetical protein
MSAVFGIVCRTYRIVGTAPGSLGCKKKEESFYFCSTTISTINIKWNKQTTNQPNKKTNKPHINMDDDYIAKLDRLLGRVTPLDSSCQF